MKMKAAIYYGPGDVKIEEVERPKAKAYGVVLKVKACGICDIVDLDFWLRGPGFIGGNPPFRFGHEYSGEVVEVGYRVKDVKVGERIAVFPIYSPCYACESCRAGDYWKCINWHKGARYWAFAEYLDIPFVTKHNCVKLPDTLSYHDLTFIEPLQFASGIGEKAKNGDVVTVFGLDVVGLGVIAKLKEQEVKVIVCDISKKRVDAAKEVGADIALDAINDDVVTTVMRETSGKGADVAILNDARPNALLEAIGSVRRAGMVWLIPYESIFNVTQQPRVDLWISPGAHFVEPPITFSPGLMTVRCCHGTFSDSRVLRTLQAIELIQSGKITSKKHVTHVFPLDKIQEALEVAANPHECIKVVVEP